VNPTRAPQTDGSTLGPSVKLATAWLVLLMAMLCLTGCGYSHKTLYPADVNSVRVDIFNNRTFYRGMEFDLTEALIKEIELRTPYKAISTDGADTVLEGTIVNVSQHLLSRRRRGGLPQEMEIQLMVDFTWRNIRTGQILADRKGFVVVGRYLSPLGESLPVGQQEVAQKMAVQIVSSLAEPW
jgi:hypothetical protein